MNIFVLDYHVVKCAQYHLDKHVVKMILETTQLLNNSLILNDPYYIPVYKLTHKNHPASLWASYSAENFQWLNSLGLALCEEYTYRYNKIHKCQSILESFEKRSLDCFKNQQLTDFVLCMPENYKILGNAVESYRNYYRGSKSEIAKWTKREKPDWWK